MEDLLSSLLESNSAPWLTALILGLMTAISPCPLATNITAVGFISRDIENKHRVFINGILYTLGRAITYTAIPLIIFFGVDQLKFSGFFQRYGEKIIGPLLIVIGLFMLDFIKVNFPAMNRLSTRMQHKETWSSLDAILLGIVFALAFCPYSGVLYFGMLVPMTVSSASGLYLPVVFALATGIPVIIFSWLLAYTVSGIGGFYHKVKTFELWFRRVIAFLFIVVGVYYIFRAWI
ncbi:MAG TPA: aromatic aminobenezylarsenical efflux permease ArsG family transporter [Tenuifilaceae bacterium]|nr:aromatic aminobenezylarsenical efflux permease ArsG family transporter [Tenuifilaceae bacterium]HOZ15082.1 aromatic aminobenezylarsenical efflux permease ArsG family transporter [Tenuifilaceae bacterium]HPI44163.1 aromatic aminobenezylarsenical efflux permease ArsG family transporter [Tenuifilaceae bacterium]